MNDANTPHAAALSSMQRSLQAMQTSRDRLRRTTAAIASGELDALAPAATSGAAHEGFSTRLQGRAGALEAAYEQMQQRVLHDISSAMQRVDAMASFSASGATSAQVEPEANAENNVIDVQAKEVPPAAPTTP